MVGISIPERPSVGSTVPGVPVLIGGIFTNLFIGNSQSLNQLAAAGMAVDSIVTFIHAVTGVKLTYKVKNALAAAADNVFDVRPFDYNGTTELNHFVLVGQEIDGSPLVPNPTTSGFHRSGAQDSDPNVTPVTDQTPILYTAFN